jgi:hypothetical protein
MTRTRTTRTPTRTTLTQTPTTRTQTQTTPTPSVSALTRCIEPLSAEEFLAERWEHSPLAVVRHEEGRFDDLLSTADVERLVCSSGIRYPAFRLVKAGKQFAVSSYTEAVPWRPSPFTATASVERVLEEFEAGATIVLQGLHLNWGPLTAFCRELDQELGEPAQANAYYTPRGSQGLSVHHDTHDVFVLQVAGEKRWLVYPPALELPLRNQRYTRELGEPGEPVEDLVLRAGDTLYLPRGWLHEALTSETDSLHITVGVNVHTWLDAFRLALDECSEEYGFRRSVGAGGEDAESLLEALRDRLDSGSVAARKRQKLVETRRPVLDGQLTQLRALDTLGLDRVVERRRTVIGALVLTGTRQEEERRVKIAFEGKELSFPAHVEEEVSYVAGVKDAFRPRDIPGKLDEAGRLVLVRRLVREGFLRISEP